MGFQSQSGFSVLAAVQLPNGNKAENMHDRINVQPLNRVCSMCNDGERTPVIWIKLFTANNLTPAGAETQLGLKTTYK